MNTYKDMTETVMVGDGENYGKPERPRPSGGCSTVQLQYTLFRTNTKLPLAELPVCFVL